MTQLIPAPHSRGGRQQPARRAGRDFRLPARLAASALVALLAPGLAPATATTLARMSVQELAQQATYVARVRCAKTASVADENLVWTLTRFDVIETWKGSPPSPFILRLPGGEAAGLRVAVEGAPRFSVGEEVVLFVTADRGRQMNIVSWAQGTFRIRQNPRTGVEEAVQDTAGLQILDANSGRRSTGGRRQFPLAELRTAVSRAVREGAR